MSVTHLRDVYHADLTPYVVRLLLGHRIKTVTDFLKIPSSTLATKANLCHKTVDELKQHLVHAFGPITHNGLIYKDRALGRTFLLQTGIKSLDDLLEPGIISGSMVELCGAVTTGKSMLLATIAIHVARQHKFRTLFIDTKRSFSGFRIYSLLKELGCSQAECGEVMHRIHVKEVSDAMGLVALLRTLNGKAGEFDYQIIVLDSLMPLLFPYSGIYQKKGLLLLTDAMTLCKELTERRNIVLFVKGLILGDRPGTLTSTVSRYWPTVPAIRLIIEHDIGLGTCDTSTHQKCIRVLKSNQHASGRSCRLRLNKRGMV